MLSILDGRFISPPPNDFDGEEIGRRSPLAGAPEKDEVTRRREDDDLSSKDGDGDRLVCSSPLLAELGKACRSAMTTTEFGRTRLRRSPLRALLLLLLPAL